MTAQGPLTQGDTIPSDPQGSANNVFKIHRYAPDYPGFTGHALTPGDPIELYTTAINDPVREIPGKFELYQNYPNPFNPSTTIKYQLSTESQVELKIYNLLGQAVRTLVDDRKPAGSYQVQWDGRNEEGVHVSSGVYLYRLKADSYIETKKLILMK